MLASAIVKQLLSLSTPLRYHRGNAIRCNAWQASPSSPPGTDIESGAVSPVVRPPKPTFPGVGFTKNRLHLRIEYLGFLRIGDMRRVLEPPQLLALQRLQGLVVALGKDRAPVA